VKLIISIIFIPPVNEVKFTWFLIFSQDEFLPDGKIVDSRESARYDYSDGNNC